MIRTFQMTLVFNHYLVTGMENGRIENVENCKKSQNLCYIEKYAIEIIKTTIF